MSLFRTLVILLGIVALSSLAAEPDLSTPQGAIKSLTAAIAAQDAEGAMQTLYAADDVERDLAQAFADLLVAGRKLNEAAKSKFGTTGSAVGSPAAAADALAGLDKAPVSITGDVATLASPSLPSRTVRLKRTPGGKWQLIVRDFANPADPDLAAQTAVLKKVAAVFADVAGQIEAGKFTGPQDAQAAIQSRLANVLINASRAAAIKGESTRPSTRPTTRP